MTVICNAWINYNCAKTKFANTDSDNKQVVQARTHQLVQLSPVTKIQRYQDRLAQLDKLLRSQMALVYDAKVAEVKRLSEALLMLDTSRIVARGYAIVQKRRVRCRFG